MTSGRNYLTPEDRKKNFEKIEKALYEDNLEEVSEHLNKIRSKALKELCVLGMDFLEDPNFLINKTPTELSEELGMPLRKVYDFIKTINFLSKVQKVSSQKQNQKEELTYGQE